MLHKINPNEIDRKILKEAVEALKNGKIIIYPTDTAYAIGCDATNEKAVEKVYQVKRREKMRSLPVITADLKMAEKFFLFNKKEKELAKKFWPDIETFQCNTGEDIGKLSLVLKIKPNKDKKIIFPLNVMANDQTIAVRAPNSLWSRSLSSKLDSPIISTSANLSGAGSCYSLNEIGKSGMVSRDIDLILDAGQLPVIPTSTIVRVKGNKVEILREGSVAAFFGKLKKFHGKLKNNNGSILIMSILILSGILGIGLSISAIVLNQLRQAKNLDFSIIAYYAADSATEDALFKIRKLKWDALDLNEGYGSGVFSNNAEWERNIASTTPFVGLLRKNRPVVINLYDSSQDCGQVRRVTYTWDDSTPGQSDPDLEVTYYPWNITGGMINVLPEKGEQEIYRSPPEPPLRSGPWTATSSPLLAYTCYTIRVKALYDDANVTIRTYSDFDCNKHIGIPSFLTINSLGEFHGAKQRLNTVILKDAPLSNVFEFVIFSEEPIEK
ncbi:MAG: L-threonylcarbamoyladenylate synthase [bacterium]